MPSKSTKILENYNTYNIHYTQHAHDGLSLVTGCSRAQFQLLTLLCDRYKQNKYKYIEKIDKMFIVARATCNTTALYSLIFRFYLLLCFLLYSCDLACGRYG